MGRVADQPYDLSIFEVKICASLRRNELLYLTVFKKQTDIKPGPVLIRLTNKTSAEDEKGQFSKIIKKCFYEVISTVITPNVAPYEADEIPAINPRLLLSAFNYKPIKN